MASNNFAPTPDHGHHTSRFEPAKPLEERIKAGLITPLAGSVRGLLLGLTGVLRPDTSPKKASEPKKPDPKPVEPKKEEKAQEEKKDAAKKAV